ncbi:hypothetical protein [Thiolapillus brandeum]|uniref:SoxXA-binding protein n=1 Tax=Thiolapillus brandeum TaxID=1076588 RepID=A0A7U6GKH0_9GAMM|nr:hypothetical protein [Thiolapillus brandeum]BAO45258.1 hypothetical protein TBH_C2348 [Thiolapillus brandeum]
MKKLIPIIGLSLMLTGLAQASDDALKAAYESELQETQAAVEKAASVGGEWRDIRWKKSKKKFLPNAIKAAKAGDYVKALNLLDIAKFQAIAGYKQAMAQKNAGPRF